MEFPKFWIVFMFSLNSEPQLPSFGDYMEYYLSVPLSCSNISNAQKITDLIAKKFTDCTKKIVASSQELFDDLQLICDNQEDYLLCWDQLKEDIITNCHQSGYLPMVYFATVKSVCGNDQGNSTISKLWKSVETFNQQNCLGTSKHWLESCNSLLETMTSENVCDRRDALDECLGKTTCETAEFSKLLKQLYSNGRTYMNCSS